MFNFESLRRVTLGAISLLVLDSAMCPDAFAQVTWERDLSKALTTAKKAKKLVCVDVYTDW